METSGFLPEGLFGTSLLSRLLSGRYIPWTAGPKAMEKSLRLENVEFDRKRPEEPY